MPKRPDFILQIKILNPEAFAPEAIAKSPRSFGPQDLRNACLNLIVEADSNTPAQLVSMVRYVTIDFFAFAHGSGLYNRQSGLWEALSKIASVEISQLEKGLFSREKLPEYDLAFLDHKKRLLAIAHFEKPLLNSDKTDYLKSMHRFLKRASEETGNSGIFLCYPAPFPEEILDFIRKETRAAEAVARFESILPKLGVPVNLLEIEEVGCQGDEGALPEVKLIHPDLSKKRPGKHPFSSDRC